MIMKLYRFHLKFARPTPTVSSIAITVYSTRDLPMQPKNAAATAANGSGSARQRQLPCAAAAVVAAAAAAVRCRWSLPLPLVAAVAAASRHCRCRRRWLGCLFFHGVSPVWPLGSKMNSMRMQWAETAPVGRSSPSLQICTRGRSSPYHQRAWGRYRRLSAPT